MQNLQQQLGAESQLQALPPAVQKAIFLHLTQQPQKQESQSQGNEPQRAESQDDNSNRGGSQINTSIVLDKNCMMCFEVLTSSRELHLVKLSSEFVRGWKWKHKYNLRKSLLFSLK